MNLPSCRTVSLGKRKKLKNINRTAAATIPLQPASLGRVLLNALDLDRQPDIHGHALDGDLPKQTKKDTLADRLCRTLPWRTLHPHSASLRSLGAKFST